MLATIMTAVKATESSVELTFTLPTAVNPRDVSWKVLYTGGNLILTAEPIESPLGSMKPADGKDDADLYLTGSMMAGHGSAPIYGVDSKIRWTTEVGAWDLGVAGAATVNGDAKLPAASTSFDLDAINVAAAARYWTPNARLAIDLEPARLDFTKDLGALTGVAAARGILVLPAFRKIASFYPFAGWELGAPLRKPDSLYEQSVDLAKWTTINRGLIGASAVFHLFQPEPSADELYLFSVNVSYVARKPFTVEPFVTMESVDGKDVSVTRLRQNVRQEVEASLTWNANKYAGVLLQYKYGSLPPVFKLADHQITLGVTLKAKYGTSRALLSSQ